MWSVWGERERGGWGGWDEAICTGMGVLRNDITGLMDSAIVRLVR